MENKKKQSQNVYEIKKTIIKHLIDNNFRCHSDTGYHNASETDDILMAMPITALESIAKNYQKVIDEKIRLNKSITPLYNKVRLVTGLGHWVK